jgi:hypothetical protein
MSARSKGKKSGNEQCREELDRMRKLARTWQTIHEGADRGLALAEF